VEEVAGQLARAVGLVRESIASALSSIGDMLRRFASYVQRTISSAADIVRKNVSVIVRYVDEARKILAEALERFIETLRKGIEKLLALPFEVVKQIVEAGRNLIDRVADFVRNIPRYAAEAIKNVQEWIWRHLPDWAKEFFQKAPDALKQVGVALTGFINAILKFPEWFPKWFEKHIAKPITEAINNFAKTVWELMPDWLKQAFKTLAEFLAKIPEAIKGIAERISQYLADPSKLVSDIWNALKTAGEYLWSGINWLIQNITKLLGEIAKAVADAVGGLVGTVSDVVLGIVGRVVDIVKTIIDKLLSIAYKPIPEELREVKLDADFGIIQKKIASTN